MKQHRNSGGSDQYSVLGEGGEPGGEKGTRKEGRQDPDEFVIDVTETVPKSMSLQSLLQTTPQPIYR